MIVLGIDFETNGIDPEQSEVLEIGAVLWDLNAMAPINMFSYLIRPEETHFFVEDDVKTLTGILEKDLYSFGSSLKDVVASLQHFTSKASYIFCHYGIEFDRLIFNNVFKKTNIPLSPLHWVDTAFDIPFPDKIITRKLEYLAAEHGFLPTIKHRALFDVLTMFNIVSRYDADYILNSARSPLLRVSANVSYEQKDQAFKHGFHWDREKRSWNRIIRKAEMEKSKFPFNITAEVIYDPLE